MTSGTHDISLFLNHELAEKYYCSCCQEIARDPRKCAKRHTVCSPCFTNIIREGEPLCPICRILMDSNTFLTSDEQNEHLSLQQKCPVHDFGCVFVGTLQQAAVHVKRCDKITKLKEYREIHLSEKDSELRRLREEMIEIQEAEERRMTGIITTIRINHSSDILEELVIAIANSGGRISTSLEYAILFAYDNYDTPSFNPVESVKVIMDHALYLDKGDYILVTDSFLRQRPLLPLEVMATSILVGDKGRVYVNAPLKSIPGHNHFEIYKFETEFEDEPIEFRNKFGLIFCDFLESEDFGQVMRRNSRIQYV